MQVMQMMRGRCGKCNWQFDVCTLPMPVTEAAAVMQAAHCPMCASKKIFVANHNARALVGEEIAHKALLLENEKLERTKARDTT